jgi:hypothetical protein
MAAPPGDLRYFLVVSAVLHLAAFVGVRLVSSPKGNLRQGHGQNPIELDFTHSGGEPSDRQAEAPTSQPQPTPSPPQRRPVGATLATARQRIDTRPEAPTTLSHAAQPHDKDGVVVPGGPGLVDHLCLRNCTPAPAAPTLTLRRSAVERPSRALDHAPVVVQDLETNHVHLKRYADGGRLFSSTIGPQEHPDIGSVGLADLASGMVGTRTGLEACNPYRTGLGGKDRTLVILVDTSGSMGSTGVACASGAALAAMQRGYPIEVFNFSSRTLHQPPTRDPNLIYEVVRVIQRQGTDMNSAYDIESARHGARDIVAITDTVVRNRDLMLPTYRDLLRNRPDNRGVLFLLGDGQYCKRCAKTKGEWCLSCLELADDGLQAFKAAGFHVNWVESQGDARDEEGQP